MTDQPQNEPQAQGQPVAPGPGEPVALGAGPSVASVAGQPVPPPPPPPPGPPGASAVEGLTAKFDERPELAAGAAFAGGFVLALILKRLAR